MICKFWYLIVINWKLDRNYQFKATRLPVVDPAISYASGIPFLLIYCYIHCTLSLAVKCIVIGPVCGFACVCVWVSYHDNSKLRASIFTKLGL